MRTAVVDVGGGLRGVYATGVLAAAWRRVCALTPAWAFPRGAPTSPPTWPGKRGGTTSFTRSIPAPRSTWAWHSAMGKRGVRIRCCLYTCSPSISDSRSKFCT